MTERDYRYVEIETRGVYDDGSSRVELLEFELPDGSRVRPGEAGGVELVAPMSRDGRAFEVDPALLVELVARFKRIGT